MLEGGKEFPTVALFLSRLSSKAAKSLITTAYLTGVPLRSCVMKRGVSLSCCIKDESRSLGFGDQKLESNRPMRHSLRVFVVSDKGKGNQSTMIEHIEVKDFTVFDGLKTENAKKAEERRNWTRLAVLATGAGHFRALSVGC